jgi:hypothetical protein
LFGLCRVTVNAETLKIQHIEAFLDNDAFITVMEGKMDPEIMAKGQSLLGEAITPAIEKISTEQLQKLKI